MTDTSSNREVRHCRLRSCAAEIHPDLTSVFCAAHWYDLTASLRGDLTYWNHKLQANHGNREIFAALISAEQRALKYLERKFAKQ